MSIEIGIFSDDYPHNQWLENWKYIMPDTWICKISTNLYFNNCFDIIFVDFGLLDTHPNTLNKSINILQNYYNSNIKIVWFGGLSGHYNSAAMKLFPRKKFLHNLEEIDIDMKKIKRIINKKGVDK